MKLSNSIYLPKIELPKKGLMSLNDSNEVCAALDELANLKISRGRQRKRDFQKFPALIVWGEQNSVSDKKGRYLRMETRQPYFATRVSSSEEQDRILKFGDYFKIKHEFRGHKMKRFGV
jgi:hypothetical protein